MRARGGGESGFLEQAQADLCAVDALSFPLSLLFALQRLGLSAGALGGASGPG